MIRTEEGKELIKRFKDLTFDVDDTGSYWNPDGGGKNIGSFYMEGGKFWRRKRGAKEVTEEQHQYKEVLYLAKKAHKILKCRGVTRSDFRFYKNKFFLLETNTQPGMTKLSLVPEIANYCGISFEDLVVWMVKDASNNR